MNLRLSPWVRGCALVAACVGTAALSWVSKSTPAHAGTTSTATAPEGAEGDLRLSPTQWQSLDIEPVGVAAFPTLAIADGIVSVDENTTVPIFSPASGRVLSVGAEVGQVVRAGQSLAEIVGAETAQAGADVSSATAGARSARQQLELARAAVARQQGLIDAGGGTMKDLLQSRTDLVGAQGAVDSAEAGEVAAIAKARALGIGAGRVAGNAGETRLTSPISGVVIQRQIASGQLVASLASGASTPLFTVSDLRHVWVVASVNDADARRIRPGQPVSVTALDDTGTPMGGRIAWVAPAVDAVSHRLSVRIELPNPQLDLKPQMSLRVRVLDPRSAKVAAIRNSAIVFDGADAHCFVESGTHTVAARQLKLGRREAGFTEVLSGLKVGERVVVRGALFVDTVDAGASS